MAALVDQYGKAIQPARLRKRPTLPSLAQVRDDWSSSFLGGLTPQRVADVLRRADEGDPNDYLKLASDMEIREPHYGAVLSTRKIALHGLQPVVEAASEKGSDTKIAEEVQNLVESSSFRELLTDLTDGLAKGYSVCEIVWETTTERWTPARYVWHDPRLFKFDDSGRLGILQEDGETKELPPWQFCVHAPRLWTGSPIRSGLARLASWAFLLKITSVADWAGYSEVYGQPLRLGKYGPSTTEEDIRALLRALANLGSDGAAAIPEGMSIEFVSPSGSGSGEAVFRQFCSFLDAQISKAILGQTMTSDDGSSLAQAEVHDRVRHDILQGDARQLAATISRDLIDPFVRLNWAGAEPPKMSLPLPNKQDPAALVAALQVLVPMGLKVEAPVMLSRLGLAEPAPDAEVLHAPASSPPPPARAGARGGAAHLGAQGRGEEVDEIDEIENDMLGEWEPVAQPLLRGARTAVREASSYDDLGRKLGEVRPDSAALAKDLRAANMIARAKGDG